MQPPPAGNSAYGQVQPGTPNPELAAASIGWAQVAEFVNGGMVSGIEDVLQLRALGAQMFPPLATI